MIHEEICTYEVAKLAKEMGFPQDVFGTCEMKSSCYLKDGRYYKDGCIYPIEEAYTAPTQSLLQRWLREEKGVTICVDILMMDGFLIYQHSISKTQAYMRLIYPINQAMFHLFTTPTNSPLKMHWNTHLKIWFSYEQRLPR